MSNFPREGHLGHNQKHPEFPLLPKQIYDRNFYLMFERLKNHETLIGAGMMSAADGDSGRALQMGAG